VALSGMVRDELQKNNINIDRNSLQDMGNKLREQFGGQVLAERALAKYRSYDAPLIIKSIKNLDEINFLKENSEFYLIGVDAPFEKRWERIRARNKDVDLLNHDKFVIEDARDRGFNEPLNGQQVAMCLVHADFLINNDEDFTGPIDNTRLNKQVNEIYRKIMKK